MEILNKDQQRYQFAKMRVQKLKGFYSHLFIFLIFNTFIIYANTRGEKDWDNIAHYWSTLVWSVILLLHALTVFLPNFFLGQNWEERKIRDLMEKERLKKL